MMDLRIQRWQTTLAALRPGCCQVGTSALSQDTRSVNRHSRIVHIYVQFEGTHFLSLSRAFSYEKQKYRLALIRKLFPKSQKLGFFSTLIGWFSRAHFSSFLNFLKERNKNHKALMLRHSKHREKKALLARFEKAKLELEQARRQAEQNQSRQTGNSVYYARSGVSTSYVPGRVPVRQPKPRFVPKHLRDELTRIHSEYTARFWQSLEYKLQTKGHSDLVRPIRFPDGTTHGDYVGPAHGGLDDSRARSRYERDQRDLRLRKPPLSVDDIDEYGRISTEFWDREEYPNRPAYSRSP